MMEAQTRADPLLCSAGEAEVEAKPKHAGAEKTSNHSFIHSFIHAHLRGVTPFPFPLPLPQNPAVVYKHQLHQLEFGDGTFGLFVKLKLAMHMLKATHSTGDAHISR